MHTYNLQEQGVIDAILCDYLSSKLGSSELIKLGVSYHLLMMIWVSSHMEDKAEGGEHENKSIKALFSKLDEITATSSGVLQGMHQLLSYVHSSQASGVERITLNENFEVVPA